MKSNSKTFIMLQNISITNKCYLYIIYYFKNPEKNPS